MKGVIFYIAFIFCCLLPVSTVYAGSLNEYEKQVVAEAKKTYVYNGKEYRATEETISQLIGYLSQDDVDITAEQRDEALQRAYSSIEQGVLEGYLVPVEVTKEEEKLTPIPTPAPNESEGQVELPVIDIIDGEQQVHASTGAPQITPKPSGEEPTTELSLEEEQKKVDALPNSSTSIITETGFDFRITLYVIAGLGMLMIFGLVAAHRLKYFAHDDE
jgi:hypothetical protein